MIDVKWNESAKVIRSIKKSLAASVVGSVVTNPLDVAQNEMYQTGERFLSTALTMFLTDTFLQRL
eukprot:Skav209065  [mRNA]  locus=scaffold760:333714:336764:+ [translate_table: standard]